MAEAAYQMQAYVALKEGMRLFYDCPSMSGESFEADNFFQKYQGKTATIADFPAEAIGLLNREGRLPGMYLKAKCINVRFEGEDTVHNNLYLHHFVLLDATSTMTHEEWAETQHVGDLPNPVLFYPGDTVYKAADLFQELRMVSEVRINDNNEVLYVLAETDEVKAKRKAARAARIAGERAEIRKDPKRLQIPMSAMMPDFPNTETCRGEDLGLLTRGNLYALYENPASLSFASADEERVFWSQDGISRTVYGKRSWHPNWEWPLATANAMVERGEGDLVLMTDRRISRALGDRDPVYRVRRLHDCFAQHRDHVRALPTVVAEPSVKEA